MVPVPSKAAVLVVQVKDHHKGTELNKRRAELAMSIAGTDGLKFDGQVQSDIAPVWLRTKANSIEGGTSEVQLNIIAKNVLRLPGA